MLMKKLFTFFLALVAGVGTAFGWDNRVDGIYYNFDINTKSASVASWTMNTITGEKYTDHVAIPDTVRFNGITYRVTAIESNAFHDCQNLVRVDLGKNISKVGEYAFTNCTSLVSVYCRNTTPPTCSENAFNKVDFTYATLYVPFNCESAYKKAEGWNIFGSKIKSYQLGAGTCGKQGDNLTWEVDINGQLTISGKGDMADYDNVNLSPWAKAGLENAIERIRIFYGVTGIGNYAFAYCKKIKEIYPEGSIKRIGVGAFSNCTSMIAAGLGDGVTIGDNAFEGCTALIDVELYAGENATTIGEYAFKGCKSLSYVKFPDNITTIGDYAFSGCSKLTSIQLGKEIRSLNNTVFENCPLKSVSITSNAFVSKNSSGINTINKMVTVFGPDVQEYRIEEGITDIGSYAFEGCTGMTKIYLPSTLTEIRQGALQNCSALQSIVCDAVIPPACKGDVFKGVRKDISVEVPAQALEAYQEAEEWKDFFNTIVSNEIYAVLSKDGKTLTLYYDDQRASRDGMIYWASDMWAYALTTIVLDESMQNARPTNISEWFANFTKVTSIEHLDYLNTSEVTDMSFLFLNCYALKTLDVSRFDTKNVTNMSGMFDGCSALTELNVSGFDTRSVTKMTSMFNYCSNLTTLNLASFNTRNVMDIGGMFYYCSNLKTIYSYSDWSQSDQLTNSYNMFYGCTSLVGGYGTAYNENITDATYAHPDEYGNRGYFTKPLTTIYATLVDNEFTLYRDDQWLIRPGVATWWSAESGAESMFINDYTLITSVTLDESMNKARPITTDYWFYGMDQVTEIENLDFLNTENVTSMNAMFSGCSKLESLNLSNFNTEKVMYMASMFRNCSALTTIYCDDDWSTRAALEISDNMFTGCTSLIGGNGTAYDKNITDATYARPDEEGNPGYFTKTPVTAIGEIEASANQGEAQKIIRNGILYLLRDGKTYNALGQTVK